MTISKGTQSTERQIKLRIWVVVVKYLRVAWEGIKVHRLGNEMHHVLKWQMRGRKTCWIGEGEIVDRIWDHESNVRAQNGRKKWVSEYYSTYCTCGSCRGRNTENTISAREGLWKGLREIEKVNRWCSDCRRWILVCQSHPVWGKLHGGGGHHMKIKHRHKEHSIY